MRITALRILEKIKGADTEDGQDAMKEYAALVDRFYQANEHHMAKKQCHVAKRDAEYFIRLLRLRVD